VRAIEKEIAVKFHEYHTMHSFFKNYMGIREEPQKFYDDMLLQLQLQGGFTDLDRIHNTTHNQMVMEARWYHRKRPYYNVWPAILPMLLRLNLNIESSLISPPENTLCIRLPVEKNHLAFEFNGERHEVHTIMMVRGLIRDASGMSMWIDIGESDPTDMGVTSPVYTFRNFQCVPGLTVDQAIASLPAHKSAKEGIVMPDQTISDCVRLACTICLLDDDPELVSPDVLTADVAKWEATHDRKFVEKAHRRGKVGWDVGKHIEVIPHIRRPHPALYWTGKGGTIPRIQIRKGSLVHRAAIENIPTGHMDK
jgi:hypothetical protein